MHARNVTPPSTFEPYRPLDASLCKRARKKWTQLHKAFDSPATIRNGTSTRETKIVDLLSSKTLRDLSAKSLNNAVFVTPRTGSTVRERVPAQASVVFDSRDVVTPKVREACMCGKRCNNTKRKRRASYFNNCNSLA